MGVLVVFGVSFETLATPSLVTAVVLVVLVHFLHLVSVRVLSYSTVVVALLLSSLYWLYQAASLWGMYEAHPYFGEISSNLLLSFAFFLYPYIYRIWPRTGRLETIN